MNAYKEELLIEFDEIKKLLDLSSNLFNIRTAFIYAIGSDRYTSEIAGNNGGFQPYCNIIQQELRHRCIACDREKFLEARNKKRPVLYRCYNGLSEMFLPLFIENILVGYLHFGQIRTEAKFETIATECSLLSHSKLDELKACYESMHVIPHDQLILIAELFQMFSDIILKRKLIEIKKAKPEYYLKKYVDENIEKPINVQTAAEYVGRSTSFVTHRFREIYGITFHEYLCESRIKYSKKLLEHKSICETFQLCGFNNRYHFSKVFKKVEGLTPFEYQEKIKKMASLPD